MSRTVYADYAATTPVLPEVLDAMLPYFCRQFGNPSSIYSLGREAHAALDRAREQTALLLGARPEEIFFTSGGSEADNWAIRGAAYAQRGRGRHIVASAFEHHAVLHTLAALEREGFEVTYLPVPPDGVLDPAALTAALRPDTTLVTLMYANNEIGTIQPVGALAAIARAHGALFHTDAVQAAGHLPIDVAAQGIDLLSLSAHKFGGPKGVGALFVRKGLRPARLIEGGAQEKGRRAGTENIPGIVGLGEAAARSADSMEARAARVQALRDLLLDGLLAKIPGASLNGDRYRRLPGNINLSFRGVEGESLLVLLDAEGICASAGSACAAGSLEPSHVLRAIGLPDEAARSTLRLTLGAGSTKADVDAILAALPAVVARLRGLAPAWEDTAK